MAGGSQSLSWDPGVPHSPPGPTQKLSRTSCMFFVGLEISAVSSISIFLFRQGRGTDGALQPTPHPFDPFGLKWATGSPFPAIAFFPRRRTPIPRAAEGVYPFTKRGFKWGGGLPIRPKVGRQLATFPGHHSPFFSRCKRQLQASPEQSRAEQGLDMSSSASSASRSSAPGPRFANQSRTM